MESTKQNRIKQSFKIISIGISVIVFVLVVWFLVVNFQQLKAIFLGGNVVADLGVFVESLGARGVFALAILQMLQIVIAILPGEPIELASGALYGGFLGGILCLISAFAGTIIVYYLVKKLGKGMLYAFNDENKVHKFKFWQDSKKAEVLTFVLFLIPLMPKDFFAFLAPFASIKPWKFFLISILGRAPGMFITTYAGLNLLHGNFLMIWVLYGILALGAIIGIIYYKKST